MSEAFHTMVGMSEIKDEGNKPIVRNPDTGTKPERHIGISDVSKLAGVSIGTVSNYLNYPDRVSDRLKFKIQKAVEALGYTRTPKQHTNNGTMPYPIIGFVITDVENSVFISAFEGIQEACDAEGMQVVAVNALSDKERQTSLVRMFCQMKLQGILLSSVFDSQDDIAFARAAGIPIVMIDHLNPAIADNSCSILKNDEAACQLAVHELISTGCNKLAFAYHAADVFQPIHNRLLGFEKAADQDDVVDFRSIDSAGNSFEDGVELGNSLAHAPAGQRPDGVVAATDTLAAGLLTAFQQSGLRIPQDVSVIGLEGDTMDSISPVPMTVVESPGVDMGRQAMLQLVDEVTNPSEHVHTTQLLMPRLIRRASTRESTK